ncbi:SAM-dependent methyltransferase [Sulfitobacter sp. JB4-11]|uniref:SAM-dependent methyltransferase n=1 Tax=Sulfitobacter rhodophyticola TaxID=3238304 RepID=UPI003A799591
MTKPPQMTDPNALVRRQSRATAQGLFLHDAAADEIEDRLAVVNKSFTDTALITRFADPWQNRFAARDVLPPDETLALTAQGNDLIIHAMSLHWANDPVGQLIQCRRALRADGLLLSVSLGGQTLTELRACLGQAETSVTGGLSPRVAPMADLRDQGALLQRAGFALPVADAMPLTVEYRDAWHLMRDLRAMGEANALAARLRRPTRRAVFEAAADLYQTHFGNGAGRITATFELVFLTGWAPDESQPQPLRPGSAKHRLAEALGTNETKLHD